MEEKLIEGEFVPNKIGMGFGILGVTLLALLGLYLSFCAGPVVIVVWTPLVVLLAAMLYSYRTPKHQKLIVTNSWVYMAPWKRIVGDEIGKKEVSVPLDKITSVLVCQNELSFITKCGFISFKGCSNANAVYDVVMRLLYERDAAGRIHENTSDRNAYIAEELKVYKKLLDENLITQEEFEAKKEKLLGL